jgi:hypothetical protein
LVRAAEIDQRVEIDAARGVRDQLAREEVHPRITLERSIRQLGELEVVPARQVLLNLTDLVLDDVVVVAEPVFRRDGLRIAPRRGGQVPIHLVEPRGALVEAGQERAPTPRRRGKAVRRRERGGMRLELVLAEDLCSSGRRLLEHRCALAGFGGHDVVSCAHRGSSVTVSSRGGGPFSGKSGSEWKRNSTVQRYRMRVLSLVLFVRVLLSNCTGHPSPSVVLAR